MSNPTTPNTDDVLRRMLGTAAATAHEKGPNKGAAKTLGGFYEKTPVFSPDAILVQGDANTGNAMLGYRMPSGEVIAVMLPPDILSKTIYHLVRLAGSCTDEAVKAAVHQLASRNLAVGSHQMGVVSIPYELELGLSANTTLELADATLLRDQLTTAIDAQLNVGSADIH